MLKSKNQFYAFDLNNTLCLLTCLLFFALPFFNKFTNILITAILTLSIVRLIREKKYTIKVFWFLPALFLYYLISELLSGGALASIEKRLLFLLIPLLFTLNVNLNNESFRVKIYYSIILGNLIAILICLTRAFNKSLRLENGNWIFNPKVIQNTEYDFFTSSIMGGNYFFSDEFSYFLHPTYFGIQIVLAQYLIFEIFKSDQSKKTRMLLSGFYSIFLFTVFLLSSKAILISSLVLTFCLFLTLRSSLVSKITTVAVITVVCFLFISYNPRLKVFKDSLRLRSFIDPDPNARFGHDLRILSWHASFDLIKDNWLLGVGEANKTSELIKVYNKKRYTVPAENMHNSHNQYLDFLIGGGIIGFALFMSGLISLFISAISQKNYALLAFILIFSFNAFFENLLSRYSGILFFSVFISFLNLKEEKAISP